MEKITERVVTPQPQKKKINCVLFARCCGSSKHEIIHPTTSSTSRFFWFLFSQLLVDATSSNQPNYRGNKFLQGYQLKSLSKILFNRVSNTIDLITDQISPVRYCSQTTYSKAILLYHYDRYIEHCTIRYSSTIQS